MVLTAALLASIGAADLVRSAEDSRARVRVVSIILGSVVAVLLVSGTGYGWLWPILLIAAVAAWVLTTGSDRFGAWPSVGLAILVAVALASGAVLPVASGWLTEWYSGLPYPALDSTPFDQAALIAAYSVFLLKSANIVVREALSTTDARIQRGELRIKGGRLIGPIERIFLFWMALAGQLLAIGAIVAAKGILRYPEISEREGKKNRGALAEYVLIGSLVSWGLALVLVPLLAQN